MNRRRLALLIILLALTATVVAISVRDNRRPVVRTVRIEVPGATRAYTVLHVTDLHGRRFGDAQKRISELLAERTYDAVVITGDVAFDRGEDVEPGVELARVLAEHTQAVAYVPGNHDDMTVGSALAVEGVHDLSTQGAVDVGDGLVLAPLNQPAPLRSRDARLLVIAEHAPLRPQDLEALTDEASPPTLVLSGHMHAGQIRLPLVGAVIAPPGPQNAAFKLFPELRGIRTQGDYVDGRTASNISPGLGAKAALGLPEWPFALRWGTRAELTEIEVVPAE